MPKYLTEDDVSSAVLRFLQRHRWTVAHYHPPGGQAAIAIHLASGGRVVPDLIAYRHDTLLTIESKGTYDTADVSKLLSIMVDTVACDQLAHVVNLHAAQTNTTVASTWQFRFAHAFDGPVPVTPQASIHIIRVSRHGKITSDLAIEQG